MQLIYAPLMYSEMKHDKHNWERFKQQIFNKQQRFKKLGKDLNNKSVLKSRTGNSC